MEQRSEFIELGKITNVHGLMGEVRVDPWADSPDFLKQFQTLYIGKEQFPLTVLGSRAHKKMAIVRFEGLTDVNSALTIRNQIIYFKRSDAKLPQGHFFLTDLIGLKAINAETKEPLGTLMEVLPLPAHNIYKIQGEDREYLIPAVPAFVKETNIPEKFISIQLIEGL